MSLRVRGSWVLPTGRWRILNWHVLGWPLGLIEVRDDRLILSAVEPFAWLNRWGRHPLPLVIPLDAIDHLRFKNRWGRLSRARIASSSETYALLEFGAFRSPFDAVLNRLRTLGVTVVEW
jgi:hypothetical protein